MKIKYIRKGMKEKRVVNWDFSGPPFGRVDFALNPPVAGPVDPNSNENGACFESATRRRKMFPSNFFNLGRLITSYPRYSNKFDIVNFPKPFFFKNLSNLFFFVK